MARSGEAPNTGSKILPCACAHAFQDSRYGAGNRVHTAGGDARSPKYTCTVCKSVKGAEARPAKKAEAEKPKAKAQEKRA